MPGSIKMCLCKQLRGREIIFERFFNVAHLRCFVVSPFFLPRPFYVSFVSFFFFFFFYSTGTSFCRFVNAGLLVIS